MLWGLPVWPLARVSCFQRDADVHWNHHIWNNIWTPHGLVAAQCVEAPNHCLPDCTWSPHIEAI
ncbi:hypothetical protein GGTG_11794 [Gaeumannomyces tritici R3-111a-1]|uniref:Uncharacterized protein n=1 Tax=Gaeumannomyces tritici (strain R3-111a-1) TaxID=644352 RepID=J3PE71_GAET3|nr:hypothetical protein GGTG_11794 [Gaeumannomyces tritici R3-111a-1]EJT70771.1 hypothetical protein GGTG_11794 [Gaeumannomyces tritici R3-111a-1]